MSLDPMNPLLTEKTDLKVYLVDIVDRSIDTNILEDRMLELENLVNTFGGMVVIKRYQKRDMPDKRTYIGSGKLEEIILEMKEVGAQLLIVGNVLKPSQVYQLNEKLRPIGAKAWDRVDLILKIFDKHANGMEAKMQIELAAIRHMGPRIYGMGMELSRQGGGGEGAMRGLGETNTERMRRHLKEKQFKITEKLKEYENMRRIHRDTRRKRGIPTIGIVGYTNVGKSSLLNYLTNKGVIAENKLFATLGTNVGKLYLMTDPVLGTGKEFLLNDTIGFIRDLPPRLIQAFASTLEDSIEADLLLHIIDASDIYVDDRISVVNNILDEIGAKQKRLMVFNKIDLINTEQLKQLKLKFKDKDCIWISVYDGRGIDELRDKLINLF
ncbi:MAG: GTPase HflX [Candidatus Absconditicoccaceae bacterium]